MFLLAFAILIFGIISSCHACLAESVTNTNGTFCLAIVNVVGGQCEESQQCTQGIPGRYSECVESWEDPDLKICNCTGGTKAELGQHACLKYSGYFGNDCESDEDCTGTPGVTSACSNSGICSCLGGYLPSSEMDDCLSIRNGLGERCEELEHCQQGIPGILSACILGSCRCTGDSVN